MTRPVERRAGEPPWGRLAWVLEAPREGRGDQIIGCDPTDGLARRILTALDLMAIYTHLSLDEARALAAPFGVEVVTLTGLTAGSVNSNYALTTPAGERVFLRIYEEQSADGARGELELLAWLSARGLPVPRPLRARDGESLGVLAGKPVALFPWIEGDICCQATVTRDKAFVVGEALARVHVAGGPRPRPGRFRVEDLTRRCDQIERSSDPELAAMAAPLRMSLAAIVSERSAEAERGLCHGDLFRDNVLWQGPRLSALLDFESASDEPYAFDLAVTLLAWGYGDGFDGGLVRSMVEGYQAVRPLPAVDRRALFVEARLAALRFTTTRITDYAMKAHLGANILRDYRRFLARLRDLDALGDEGWRAMLGLSVE